MIENVGKELEPIYNYPLIGPARLHHAHYICIVSYPQVQKGKKVEKEAYEVLYIDHDHLHQVETFGLDKIVADLSEAIRLAPDHAEAYYYRGLAYQKMGEKSKAEDDLTHAKQLGYSP